MIEYTVWVLVVLMPIPDREILITAAKEYEWRSDCHEAAKIAKVEYPNIKKYTCTPYTVIRETDDAESDRTGKQ